MSKNPSIRSAVGASAGKYLAAGVGSAALAGVGLLSAVSFDAATPTVSAPVVQLVSNETDLAASDQLLWIYGQRDGNATPAGSTALLLPERARRG